MTLPHGDASLTKGSGRSREGRVRGADDGTASPHSHCTSAVIVLWNVAPGFLNDVLNIGAGPVAVRIADLHHHTIDADGVPSVDRYMGR